MYLKKLSLINFKNIREENLEFRPGINCFVGDNGAGKTNVIDAVYFLSMCKSSLAMTDGQSMRHGSDFFLLDGQYLTDGGRSESVVCAFARKGGKTLKRNGKEYERLSDHVGLIPVVIVSPADTMLISDAADERRRYLNGFISQLDRAYLQALVRYNAVLGERNRLLKISRDEQMLCIYDRQLVEQGGIIHRKRSEIAALLEPEVARYYRHLSSDREQVTLEYRSELNDTPFEELLLKSREKDFVNGFTTAGIHRDDLVLRIGGYPLRKYGSQGQQKIVSDRSQTRPICPGRPSQRGKTDPAAGRPLRQTRRRAGRTAHPAGRGRWFRTDLHHRLQPDASAHHSGQNRRRLLALHGRKRRNRAMKRSKTVTVGELLDEFFQRPYVAAKVAEGRLRDTWREIVGPAADAETTELRLENHILHVRIRSSILRNELFYQREALGAEINRRSKIRLVNAVIIR